MGTDRHQLVVELFKGTVTGSPVSGMVPDYSILNSVTPGPELLTVGFEL